MSRPSRLLISGATGFVGHYLRAAIAARWPDARVLGMAGSEGGPAEDLVFADLLDRQRIDAIVEEFRPDTLIHLAAQASVSASLKDRGLTWAVNVSGTLNLATALAAHAPEATFLFASSAEVYGAAFLSGMVSETTPPQPTTPYAKSKMLAENLLAEVLPGRLVVVRPFNHTGPGQRETFVLPSFAGQVARIESGRQVARMTVGNLSVQRDFLDVRDVVDAYCGLIQAATLPPRFTCNVSSGRALALSDLVEVLRASAKVPFEIVVDPKLLRPADLPIAYGSSALLTALTGWTPRITIETTLRDLLDWSRSQERMAG